MLLFLQLAQTTQVCKISSAQRQAVCLTSSQGAIRQRRPVSSKPLVVAGQLRRTENDQKGPGSSAKAAPDLGLVGCRGLHRL